MRADNVITFPLNNKIMFVGYQQKFLSEFDPETETLSTTDIELHLNHYPIIKNGVLHDNKMYLCGYHAMNIVDLDTNIAMVIEGGGLYHSGMTLKAP